MTATQGQSAPTGSQVRTRREPPLLLRLPPPCLFSKDAVGIEAQMHQRLADRRVNRVNLRREFFYATPVEARDLLADLAGDMVQFQESPEAIEFHQSAASRPRGESGMSPPLPLQSDSPRDAAR
jgi:hypothetical protein